MIPLDQFADQHSLANPRGEIRICDPYETRVTTICDDLLDDDAIAKVIDQNRLWLESTSRSSRDITRILFPFLDYPGTLLNGFIVQVGHALFDAGFSPDYIETINPIWIFRDIRATEDHQVSLMQIAVPGSLGMTTPLFIRREVPGGYIGNNYSTRGTSMQSVPSSSESKESWNSKGECHDYC